MSDKNQLPYLVSQKALSVKFFLFKYGHMLKKQKALPLSYETPDHKPVDDVTVATSILYVQSVIFTHALPVGHVKKIQERFFPFSLMIRLSGFKRHYFYIFL